MTLVNAKCTNCGANLKVDCSKDAAICEFCGSAFIVEKAVNNYNTINQNKTHAHIVNIYDGTNGSLSRDFEIIAGVLIKYKGASTDVVVPEGVCEIGDCAFMGMSSLHSVLLPTSVCKIGYRAFEGCKNLACIDLPSSITHIEAQAFSWCTNLHTIQIPNSVKYIGRSAFSNCKSLASISIPDNVHTIECTDCTQTESEWPFDGCSALSDIEYPSRFDANTFRGSLWFDNRKQKRQRCINNGICPDHELALSFFGKKCPNCGKKYIFGSY